MKFTDLLCQRYASPFSLLDKLISNGDFFDFVLEMIDSENERQIKELWMFKTFDITYEEFKNSLNLSEEIVDEKQLETTVIDSKFILDNFTP